MALDTIVAYARIINDEKTYFYSIFATTNPFTVMQKSGLTHEEIKEKEMNVIWMRRTLAAKHGISIDDTVIFFGEYYAESEEEILTEEVHCKYVGDYMDLSEGLYRINREIAAFFQKKPNHTQIENIKTYLTEKFVKPMTEAIMYGEPVRLFQVQSDFIDFYRGTPYQGQVRKICELIRAGEKFNTILKHVALLEATQKEDYEGAVQIKNSLDNHA